jgi:ABC-type transport system involved in cytochrome c biogenesis permease component
VFTLIAAFAIVIFTYFVVGRWSSLSRMGTEIFSALGGFGIFYATLSGPIATVDCLSRERREGTLGLLFLTDLRGYDVVLGKMVAASFDMVLGLTAALPLLALPLLVGGINLAQFAKLVLTLADIVFLSLAIGVLCSALLTSGRAALALSLCALLFLNFGLPLLGEGILKIPNASTVAGIFYAPCPLYAAALCLDPPLRSPAWRYWANLGGMNTLSWICLAVASWRTVGSWRDQPASVTVSRWLEWFEEWRKGSSRKRAMWRRKMLDKNPITWLEGRDRLQERMLWGCFFVAATYAALKYLYSAGKWPGNDALLLWPWWAHCILCVWLLIQAPRRIADDKHSGALELLLCTPLAPREIIRGNMLALRRRYGRVLLGLIAMDGFLLVAYASTHGGWGGLVRYDAFALCVWGLIVFPIQLYTFARISLYQALIHTNSLRASFAAFWRVGLLPWAIFFLFILGCDYVASHYRALRLTETLAFSAWGLSHLLPCAVFLAIANWRLGRSFRILVTASTRPPWPRRLWEAIRSPKPAPANPRFAH